MSVKMEPRVSIITLGVTDLKKSRDFYEKGLGWKASAASNDKTAFFQLGGLVLGLYGRDELADDAEVSGEGQGFKGFTLAYNVRDKEDVAAVLSMAEKAGGKITKPAQDVFWGGHSGYFADPEGYLWEVAWNPYFEFNEKGELVLP